MREVNQEFLKDVLDVISKHKLDKIDVASSLGQVLTHADSCSIQNDMPWFTGAFVVSTIVKHNLHEAVKKVEKKVREEGCDFDTPYNFCDCDVDVWAYREEIKQKCLTCDSLMNKIKGLEEVKREDCPRCKGSGIDPEYVHGVWVIFENNHGNSIAYTLRETPLSVKLSCRKYPYNMSKERSKDEYKKLIEAAKVDQYDASYEYLRYHDIRDKGFVFSVEYDTKVINDELPKSLSGEANEYAPFAISNLAGLPEFMNY